MTASVHFEDGCCNCSSCLSERIEKLEKLFEGLFHMYKRVDEALADYVYHKDRINEKIS